MTAPEKTVIRASSLPQYPDCPRRHAARLFPKEVAAAGYELVEMLPSIGAIIGTGTHEALGYAMSRKMKGEPINHEDFKALTVASIDSDIKNGVVWDQTTSSPDAAYKQAIRQARITLQTLCDDIHPIAVEQHLEANLGEGFALSGHIDILERGRITDFKTGSVQRANHAQYGGYSLLTRSHDHIVTQLQEIYIPRVGHTKPQPDPVVTAYAVRQAEKDARVIIDEIKNRLKLFRAAGDSSVYIANPNSMMCSPDYCPAFGTKFCQSHKPRKENQ